MAKKKSDGVLITKSLGEVKPEVQPEVKPEIKPEVQPEIKPEAKPEISEPKIKNKRKRGSLKKKLIKSSTESLSRVLPSTTPDILPITDNKFKFSKKHIGYAILFVLLVVGIYKRDYIEEKLLQIYFTKIKKFNYSEELG